MRPRLASVDIPGYHGPATLLAFPQLARRPLEFFTDTARRCGDLAWIRIASERIVLVSSPTLIEDLLWRQHSKLEKDHITKRLRMALGDGLLTAEGERWRSHRRSIAPSFQRQDLTRYATIMREASARAVARLPRQGSADLRAVCSELTLDIVHHCLFGSDVAIPAERIGQALDRMMSGFLLEMRSLRRFVPERIPTDTRREVLRALAEVDDVLLSIITERRNSPRPDGERHDLLARLMQARDDQGQSFTDQELRDEAITVFIAGHETTALALTYALTALSWRPECRDRLRDELSTVLGGAPIDLDTARTLPYLRAVLLETLRLYPPAWGFGRQGTEPISLGGHTFPVGCAFYVVPWVLHRDTTRFPEPFAFRPERWLDGLEQQLPRGAFLPFGGGPRTCIGQHFAMLELMVALGTLVQHADLNVNPAHDLRLEASVTLRPGGPVPATVVCR
jgi:cytochrome P450